MILWVKTITPVKIIGVLCPMLGLALGEYIPLCYMQDAFQGPFFMQNGIYREHGKCQHGAD